jgi:hypothetical protein
MEGWFENQHGQKGKGDGLKISMARRVRDAILSRITAGPRRRLREARRRSTAADARIKSINQNSPGPALRPQPGNSVDTAWDATGVI